MKRISMQWVIALGVPLILFGGIAAAAQLGWWKTAGGNAAPALIRQGNFAGMHDPSEIRGSTNFGTIETYFGVPARLIADAFGIRASDPRVVTAKFVDTLYGEIHSLDGKVIDIGTDAVKLFVARMTGLPYEAEENTGLPDGAVDILLSLGAGMTESQRISLLEKVGENRTIDFDTGTAHETAAASTEASTPQSTEAPAVQTAFSFQGKTSFADVMARGVSQGQIEAVLGMPMGNRLQSVKEFCEAKGLRYSDIRTELGRLIDSR